MNFMSDKYFVDTNILVYAHDRSAGPKHHRARAVVEQLWHSGQGVLSTQVLQELCVSFRRKSNRPLSSDELIRVIQDYLSWEVVVNDPGSVVEALQIEARYKVAFWDALILHAAETAGAVVLYSEDLAAGQIYGSTRVINPLTDC
jgi:predicted nucleic acid-binding protein